MAGEDTIDVAVDDGGRQSEGKAADSSSGVVANALEGAQAFNGGGKTATCNHLLGGRVEIARPAVVA